MDRRQIEALLEQIHRGEISVSEGVERLRHLPFEDLGFARLDGHRGLRCGFPEVIFSLGKTSEQIAKLSQSIVKSGGDLLATRATPENYEAVRQVVPAATYHEAARAITCRQSGRPPSAGLMLVLCAGTADIPVAEEARVTAELMGSRVKTLYDVGVAGIHRLLEDHDLIMEADVLVVVAGMEGALASVVGGLANGPVIAVPTSVGYGASFEGVAPLLTMLNSCAAGVAVVNIDNGFGAGYIASLILTPPSGPGGGG